ncbi:MAG: type II toxin-antitoxin system VapC family toxin [Chloroflexi bacterium]|nr:type II toxin-antitoxin system VapC family toxin [Chloroflexota bacterium]
MYVTDTHPIVYYAMGKRSRVGQRALRVFEQADSGRTLIHVPSIVLWEVAVLVARGHVALPQRFDHWCRSLDSSPGFSIVPLEWSDVEEARKLPFKDPYDCLIAGTAVRLGLPLITRDEAVVKSSLVETCW